MSGINPDSRNPSPVIAAALDSLQPYFQSGRITASVRPGGAMLEIRILDPTLTLPAPPTLQLLHQSTDTLTPSVYGDPAAGLAPF
jgi:hypothetical protein